MRKPLSFIVITHKNSLTLRACLNSVENQFLTGDELILVLNNPDPATSAIAHAAKGWNIVYEDRPGPQYARNAGSKKASNGHLVFLDSDICLSADWAEKMLAYFSVPWMGAGQSYIRMEKASGLVNVLKRLGYITFFNHYYFRKAKIKHFSVPTLDTAALMVRKDWFEKIGGFKNQFSRLEDTDFTLRLLYAGADIFLADDALAYELDDKESLWSFLRKHFLSSQYQPLLFSSHGFSFSFPFGPGGSVSRERRLERKLVMSFWRLVLKLTSFLGLATSSFTIEVEPKFTPAKLPNVKASLIEGRDPLLRIVRVGRKSRFLDINTKKYFKDLPG